MREKKVSFVSQKSLFKGPCQQKKKKKGRKWNKKNKKKNARG